MSPLQQLQQGLLASLLVIGLALLIALGMPVQAEMGWVSVLLNAMVPTQMVMTLFWRGAYPAALATVLQPWRGLLLTLLNLLLAAGVAALAVLAWGGGQMQPTPFVIMPLIISIPLALTQIVLFQAWPFTRWTDSVLVQGLLMLVATYGLAMAVDRFLFDFGFLCDVPFYTASLDHHGLFMAWQPVTALVGGVAGILVLILLDFWPMEKLGQWFPVLNQQPWRGLVLSAMVALLVAAAWVGFVSLAHWDLVVFMVRVCVAAIFGIFVLLILFKNLPFLKLPQPLRGLVLCVGAALLAVALFALYQAAASARFALAGGAPQYTLELWIASAMLAITFPLMVAFADYFSFWPMAKSQRRG
jgi:hypothetical protein